MALSIQNAAENRRQPHRKSFPLRFLLISAAVHAVVFLAVQKTVSWPHFRPEPEIFKVQLIRHPVDTAHLAPETSTIKKSQAESPYTREEDTIRLGEVKGKYADYAAAIKERLESAWIYPQQAREEAIEGTSLMHFTIEKTGELSASRLTASSGHPCLDDNALQAVAAAAPYPRFPDHFSISRLHVEASFTYQLEPAEPPEPY
jgi:periplasmic protein TonB